VSETTGAPNEWDEPYMLAERVVRRRRAALEQLSCDTTANVEVDSVSRETIDRLLEEYAELWRQLARGYNATGESGEGRSSNR